MCSKSSSSTPGELVPVGEVAGHRGRGGELTVKVPAGDASFWNGLQRIWLETHGHRGRECYEVEAARSYRDRLVLKLSGVDDASAAEALRGRRVVAALEDAPQLPQGRYYRSTLVGMEVRLESQRRLGRVADVRPTGGADLLAVDAGDEEGEILIPLVEEIVIEVDEAARRITVRPPEGLLELNRTQVESET